MREGSRHVCGGRKGHWHIWAAKITKRVCTGNETDFASLWAYPCGAQRVVSTNGKHTRERLCQDRNVSTAALGGFVPMLQENATRRITAEEESPSALSAAGYCATSAMA